MNYGKEKKEKSYCKSLSMLKLTRKKIAKKLFKNWIAELNHLMMMLESLELKLN